MKTPALPPDRDPPTSDLDRLFDRAKGGDEAAWQLLVGRLQRLVYSVPYRFRMSEEDADDVFVATFEAMYRNLDRIDCGRALPRWLATTAARECLRIRRLKGNQPNESLEEVMATEDAVAETEAVRADNAEQVRIGLAKMAPRCRDLLAAIYTEEEPSHAEVAQRLGIPLGAIGPTRQRCLDKLRRIMRAQGFYG